MKYKKGFTLIELLVIIAIISLLAAAILISMNQSRRNARLNGAKTSMKSVLPAIVACRDGGGAVNFPSAGVNICSPTTAGLQNAKWPALTHGYTYGTYNSSSCEFVVNTSSDRTKLGNTFITCNCTKQICE